MSTVRPAPTAQVRGFDVWSPLSASVVSAAVELGYVFCCRYVDNLTSDEVSTILDGGLALILAQQAPAIGGYTPTGNGTVAGQRAAAQAAALGIPRGVCLFFDLEDTSGNTSTDVAAYANAWYHAVQGAGYEPGLYVGTSMFSGSALREDFAFARYWLGGVANLPFVYARGYQLYQSGQTTIDGLTVDEDFAQTDLLGGTLPWLVGGGDA